MDANEQLVLTWLEDEESRFIFEKRVLYNKTNDFSHIKEITKRYLPQFEKRNYYPGKVKELIEKMTEKKNIVFFGAGARLQFLFKILKDERVQIRTITDNNPSLWGRDDNGILIVEPDKVKWNDVDFVLVTPFKTEIVQAVCEQLLSYGVDEEIIHAYNDFWSMADEENQYFDQSIIQLEDEEVFVDAGALDLSTSIRFAKRCREADVSGKIYAFEPDELLYNRSKKVLETNKELIGQVYNAGLWSSETTLYFNCTHGGDGKIVETETDTSIKVVSLDNCIEDKVTFIKMDIEGSELEALKGSRLLIQKYKPKLAISVYHKPEDIVTLPMYIKELVPEYKLYMRHYSDGLCETVLYAVENGLEAKDDKSIGNNSNL